MEKINGIKRSEAWNKIYEIVKTIPREKLTCDAPDAPSVTTSIEELFLKLLPIHGVSNQRELFNTFYDFASELVMCVEDYDNDKLYEKFKKSII